MYNVNFVFQYFESYHGLAAGDAALYVNGLPIDVEVYDMFTFLELLRSEAKLMQGLFSLGFKVSQEKKGERVFIKIRFSGENYFDTLQLHVLLSVHKLYKDSDTLYNF